MLVGLFRCVTVVLSLPQARATDKRTDARSPARLGSACLARFSIFYPYLLFGVVDRLFLLFLVPGCHRREPSIPFFVVRGYL